MNSLYDRLPEQSAPHDRIQLAYFFFGSCLCTGRVGCFFEFSSSTWRRRSSVPSSFFGLGPGLMCVVMGEMPFIVRSPVGCVVDLAARPRDLQCCTSRA